MNKKDIIMKNYSIMENVLSKLEKCRIDNLKLISKCENGKAFKKDADNFEMYNKLNNYNAELEVLITRICQVKNWIGKNS